MHLGRKRQIERDMRYGASKGLVEPLIFSLSAMEIHGLSENSKPPAPNRRLNWFLVGCSQCQRTNGVTFNPVDNVSTTNMNVLDRVA